MSEFGQYPIGSMLLSTYQYGIHRVTGHLVGTWDGSDRPWLAVACEQVAGDTSREINLARYDQLRERLVSGSLPEQQKTRVHVLNGSMGHSFVPIEQVKMVYSYRMTFFYAPRFWMVALDDPGDPSVGIPGSTEVVSNMGIHGELSCDETEYRNTAWLVDVACWLREHLQDERPIPYNLVLNNGEAAYRATVEMPRNTNLKDVLGRRFTLEGLTLDNMALLEEGGHSPIR